MCLRRLPDDRILRESAAAAAAAVAAADDDAVQATANILYFIISYSLRRKTYDFKLTR